MPDDGTAEIKTTLAVVVSLLDGVKDDIKGLRDENKETRANFVDRREWGMRNMAVDSRFEGQGREIAELKAAKAPWWTWVAALGSVSAILLSLFT